MLVSIWSYSIARLAPVLSANRHGLPASSLQTAGQIKLGGNLILFALRNRFRSIHIHLPSSNTNCVQAGFGGVTGSETRNFCSHCRHCLSHPDQCSNTFSSVFVFPTFLNDKNVRKSAN